MSNDYRIVWQYLLDHCDHAGTFKREFRLLNFQCGTNITEQQFNKVFGSRIVKSEAYDRWLIVNFCRAQYPKGLDSNKPVIVSVRELLAKYGFLTIVMQSFTNHSQMIKDKDKDKETGEGEDGGVGEGGLQAVRSTAITTQSEYDRYIQAFNQVRGASFRGDKKSRAQFNARMKEGVSVDEMIIALTNAMQNDHHQKNGFQYLTPEFFTRPDKLEMHLNAKGGSDLSRRIVRDTTAADIMRGQEEFVRIMNEKKQQDQ